jgi:hypothetical protein
MKTRIILCCFIPFVAQAGGFGTGLHNELLYLYISLITLVAIIIVTDQFLKYIFRKMREREAIEHEQQQNEQPL